MRTQKYDVVAFKMGLQMIRAGTEDVHCCRLLKDCLIVFASSFPCCPYMLTAARSVYARTASSL